MRRILILRSLGLVYSADLHAQPRGGTALPVGTIGNSAVPDTRVKTAPVVERHDRAWWAENTAGFDFSSEDKIDAAAFNRVLWDGIRGAQP